jgi:hypothetical protein
MGGPAAIAGSTNVATTTALTTTAPDTASTGSTTTSDALANQILNNSLAQAQSDFEDASGVEAPTPQQLAQEPGTTNLFTVLGALASGKSLQQSIDALSPQSSDMNGTTVASAATPSNSSSTDSALMRSFRLTGTGQPVPSNNDIATAQPPPDLVGQ